MPEDFAVCFFGPDDMDVRLPSPPEFEAGFGFGLAAVSFLKSAHRSSTLFFSSAALNRVLEYHYQSVKSKKKYVVKESFYVLLVQVATFHRLELIKT